MAPTIIIRQALSSDEGVLRKLAALDSAAAFRGDALVAEENGEVKAAVSLSDARVIADPFEQTMELADMLSIHREHVTAQGSAGRRARKSGTGPIPFRFFSPAAEK